MASGGGSAKLGEARVDIVADDKALSSGLNRSKQKVRKFANETRAAIGSAMGGGGGRGQASNDRYSIFKSGRDSFRGDIGKARSVSGMALFAGVIAAGIAKVIDRGRNSGTDALLRINASTQAQRFNQFEELSADIGSELAGQMRDILPPGAYGNDAINWIYRKYFELLNGDAKAQDAASRPFINSSRKAQEELRNREKQAEEIAKMYDRMDEIESGRQQTIGRFNDAVNELQNAAENLQSGFSLGDVGATISAIRDDIAIQTASQQALYYGGGYVGAITSYFGGNR